MWTFISFEPCVTSHKRVTDGAGRKVRAGIEKKKKKRASRMGHSSAHHYFLFNLEKIREEGWYGVRYSFWFFDLRISTR